MAANPSTKNAHQKLIEELLNNLPAGYTSANVKLPNRKFSTPSDSKWLRPTVIVQTANNVQAGGLWKRYDGVFVVDIFYPTGDDDLAQLTEAEAVAAIFENQVLDGVKCQDVLITTPGEEGAWYQVQVTIDFYFEGEN